MQGLPSVWTQILYSSLHLATGTPTETCQALSLAKKKSLEASGLSFPFQPPSVTNCKAPWQLIHLPLLTCMPAIPPEALSQGGGNTMCSGQVKEQDTGDRGQDSIACTLHKSEESSNLACQMTVCHTN